jgi:two-component system, NarL family, sensor histidine kinase DevS
VSAGDIAELDARREEVATLRRELEETNRGLIALVAELEEAREAEARLAAIVQSSDDAMLSLSLDWLVESWNRGAERLLGYGPAEITGRAADRLVREELRPELVVALERLRAGERAVAFDTWCRRRDGSLVETSVTVSAMRDPGERLIGFAVVLRDLTERRRAETELAASRAAQEVLAARDRIARDLHDGAVQAIFGVGMRLQATATMCQDDALRARLEAMVAQLDAVIADLRRHVFGVRGLAAGSLSKALSAVADEIAGQRGMSVTVDVDLHVASRLDEQGDDLVHVAREALSNASRHGRAANARVSLRGDGGRAFLKIEDDGSGFDVARARGAGHGLENFRWRAQRMAGEIEVTSRPGAGTTVRLTLPI